jgi:ATP-binding cassette subfamily B protein
MFLKNPPILILDEATSALDTETERAIQASLAELAVGRTTLVIAHRLATIQNADRIVVVDETGISEQGRHQDLLQTDGIYRRLHDAQFAPLASVN